MRRQILGRIAACMFIVLAPTGPAASADEGLAQEALKVLDDGLSAALARPMQGQVLYQDDQSVAITIGIDYRLGGTDLSADWAERVGGMLRDMGAVNVQVSGSEVRSEKLPIAGRKAVAAHLNATPASLAVTLIFLQL